MGSKEQQMTLLNVLDIQKLTSTQSNAMRNTFQDIRTMETAETSTQSNFQTLICLLEDFLAKHSQLLESGEVLKIPEEHSFLRLQELLKLSDLRLYSLKTSRAYSITIKGKLSVSSFKRWGNWGIMLNLWCLTASTSEYLKIGNVPSLSQVLEENVDQKYFLSQERVKGLLKGQAKPQFVHLPQEGTVEECTPACPLSSVIPQDVEIQRGGGTGLLISDTHCFTLDTSPHYVAGTWRTHKDAEGFREMQEGISPTIPARAREDGSGQPCIAVLTPDRIEKRQNGRRFKDNQEPMFTLNTQDRHGVMLRVKGDLDKREVYESQECGTLSANPASDNIPILKQGMTIRRLTPVECERLQAFPDGWTAMLSDTQRYKTLGNAVTTNVIEAVIKKVIS